MTLSGIDCRVLTIYLIVVAVASVALLMPQSPTCAQNTSQTYAYRLAYSASAANDAPPVTPLGVTASTLVDEAGQFLKFEGTRVAPQLANMRRPASRIDDQLTQEAVNEYWVRFKGRTFSNHHHPEAAPAIPNGVNKSTNLCATALPEATSDASAWETAYKIVAIHGYCRNATVLGATPSDSARSLEMVEPHIESTPAFFERHAKVNLNNQSARSWPFPQCDPDPSENEQEARFWHRGLTCKNKNYTPYTGLNEALDILLGAMPTLANKDGTRVVIAHLDTGYPDFNKYPNYPKPPNFHEDLSVDCYEPVVHGTNTQQPCLSGPIPTTPDYQNSDGATYGVDISPSDPTISKTSWFLTNYLHGAGTLSILAGGYLEDIQTHDQSTVHYCAASGEVHYGADPCASVFEVRIGQSFAHFNEESMAAGVKHAVDGQADVVSLSHGGVPAGVLAKAVDYAYKHGTPIFAASGDFLGFSFLSTPKTVVFPARYDQVMNVTGVTEEGLSAGLHCNLLGCIGRFWGGNGFWSNFETWLIGTNFAEPAVMNGHSVAAYTPNITDYDGNLAIPGISNDEPGTSAAVPQVAAAAAIWLEYNRQAIVTDGTVHPTPPSDGPGTDNIWTSWRKSEAVYQVVMNSANATAPPAFGEYKNRKWREYRENYLGAGVLNAKSMMDPTMNYKRPDDCKKREYSSTDLAWWPDVFGSMTFIDFLNVAVPAHDMPLHGEVENAFRRSSQTEISQIAYRSKDVTSLLAAITQELAGAAPSACENENFDFSKIPKEQWQQLARMVKSDGKASKVIRRAVAAVAGHYGG
jgi:hypothetical protein